jgi:recombination protein RecA
MPNAWKNKKNKNYIDLTEIEKNVIYGTLLGDGSIRLSGTGKSARLRINQCLDQAAFVEWKYEKLKRLVGTSPQTLPNGGWGKEVRRFTTLSFPELKEIYDNVTANEKKYVNWSWLNNITHPIALAVWYMDDGSQGKSQMTLHTESFTKQENDMLSAWMKKKWNIDCHSYPTKSYWCLRFPAKGRETFQELVRDYLIPEMKYKLLPKMEEIYCSMCGEKFVLSRRQINNSPQVLICGQEGCYQKWKNMKNKAKKNPVKILEL